MENSIQNSSTLYSIKPVQGKGLGVFASKDIPKGTRITCEKPLLSAPREPGTIDPLSVFDAFEALSAEQQKTYLSLSASQIQIGHALACVDDDVPEDFRNHVARIASIFESNAFNFGDEDENNITQGGIFPLAARFNHDCVPNVAQTWNENLRSLTVHAIRHIQEGEELCDSYVPLCQPSGMRQDELRAYGFNCQCSVCGRNSEAIAKSDEQRAMIHRLGEDLDFFAQRTKRIKLGPISPSVVRDGKDDPLNVVQYLEYLLNDEGLTGHDLIQYYAFAVWYCSSQNPQDLNVSVQWQQKLFDLNNAIKGVDHEDTVASKHRLDVLKNLLR